jgi:hypothetical protein
MKFTYYFEEDECPSITNSNMWIARAFKWRLAWELRHLDERIKEDDGTVRILKNFRFAYDGSDFDLAMEIKDIVEGIDYSKW